MTELKNLFGNRHRRGFLSNMVFKGILEIIFSVEEPVEERLRQRLIPYPCPRFPDTEPFPGINLRVGDGLVLLHNCSEIQHQCVGRGEIMASVEMALQHLQSQFYPATRI